MLVHEKKFLAAIIDIAVVLVISFLLYLLFPKIDYAKSYIFLVIYALSAAIYFFITIYSTKGYTLGLKIMGLKFINRDWTKIGFKGTCLRTLCYLTPAFYLLNLLYIFINKTQITLFDEISDTFVAKMGDTYKVSSKNIKQEEK